MHNVEAAISVGLAALAICAVATRLLAAYAAALLTSWVGLVWLHRDPVSDLGAILAAGWQPSVLLTVWAATGVRRPRTVTTLAVLLVALGVTRALFYEPFVDPACKVSCFRRDLTFADDLVVADRAVLIGAAIAATAGAATLVKIVIRAAPSARPLQPRTIAASCVGTVLVVGSFATLLTRPVAMPERLPTHLHLLLLAEAAAVVGLLLVVGAEQLMLSRRVRRMAEMVALGQKSAHDQLTIALNDPTASISVRIEDTSPVSDDGPLGRPKPGRRHTELAVRKRQVAVIDHSDSIGPADLIGRLGPQFAIAVQNDLLALQLRQQLVELESSRARVIAAADSERGRLERDLHDGAQQRVLALSFELRRGHRLAERANDVVAAERWAAATALTLTLLQRLRHIASGIYPAVLDVGGLGVALQSLATAGPTVLEIDADIPDHIAADVRRAAYAIVRDSAPSPPGLTTVSAVDGDLLITFDGARQPQPSVIDRLLAAGGTHRQDGDRWEVRLPCA